MKPLARWRIGVFVVCGLAVLLAAAAWALRDAAPRSREAAVVRFPYSVYGLQAGAPVVLRGVQLGQVSEIARGAETNREQLDSLFHAVEQMRSDLAVSDQQTRSLAQAAVQARRIAQAGCVPPHQAVARVGVQQGVGLGVLRHVGGVAHLAHVGPQQGARERGLAHVGVRHQAQGQGVGLR